MHERYCSSETPGGVWWSTLGMNRPVFIRGTRRSNSARMAGSPRFMVILSKWPTMQTRERLAQFQSVNPGLALERQDTRHPNVLKPWHKQRHISVSIHEERNVSFLQAGQQLSIVWREEFVEGPTRNHWPVILRHIFRDGHEGGYANAEHLLQQAEIDHAPRYVRKPAR